MALKKNVIILKCEKKVTCSVLQIRPQNGIPANAIVTDDEIVSAQFLYVPKTGIQVF